MPSPKSQSCEAGKGAEVLVKLTKAFANVLAGDVNDVEVAPITISLLLTFTALQPRLLETVSVTSKEEAAYRH